MRVTTDLVSGESQHDAGASHKSPGKSFGETAGLDSKVSQFSPDGADDCPSLAVFFCICFVSYHGDILQVFYKGIVDSARTVLVAKQPAT